MILLADRLDRIVWDENLQRFYQIVAEDHGRKPVGESVPLKQMKEIV
jgi:hypothetical protein